MPELRRAVRFSCGASGQAWPLREVRLEQATLEEFFVQVTANQAMASVDAKGGES